MKKNIYLLTVIFIMFVGKYYSQGTTCNSATPFCTGTTYTFPNNTGTSSEAGPNYGCLTTQPNPAWYYLKVSQSGQIQMTISQTSTGGSAIDVDFICYGPFTDPVTPCTAALTAANTVDCSYSTAATETCTITSAVAGQYYLVLITNFANVSGNITFSQTGGTGTTDCSIVVPTCPTVGFHGEDSGGNSYQLPLSLDCNVDGWLFLRANSAGQAGGPITPSVTVNVTTNSLTSGNNIYGYENDVNPAGYNSYWSKLNLPANTNYSFTMYEMDNGPNNLNFGVEMCDVSSGVDMSYTIVDNNCGGTIAAGTWGASDGSNSGSAGPTATSSGATSGGCDMVQFPTSAVSGVATYSCPTCPPSSFVTTDYGWAYFNPAQAGPGTYAITYCFDNGCGCQGCATETITVANPYSAAFTYPVSSVCQNGTNPTPTITGTTGGTFSASPAGLSLNTSTGAINVAASTPNTYTVYYSVGGGATDYSGNCNDVQSATMTIAALPTPTSSVASVIDCNNPTTTVSASGGSTYSWSGPGIVSGGSSATATVNAAGSYTATVTNAAGCSATTSVTVSSNLTPPSPTSSAAGTIDCNNTTTTVTATGGGTYSWSGPGIVSGGNSATATVNAAGSYTATVTGSNGCTATTSVTVSSNLTPPSPTSSAAGVIDCNNATTTVTATGGGTYSWSGPGVVSGGTTATATVNAAGSYTATVTGTNGCTATTSVTVSTDLTPPTPTASAAGVIDCNNSTTTVTATGGVTYSWSGPGVVSGGNTATATVNAAGSYTVTATGANGCTATASVTVTSNLTTPTPTASAAGIIDCNNTTTTVTATGGGTYSWSGPGIVSGGSTATATVNAGGAYTVTVTGSNGCTATANATVTTDLTPPSPTASSAGVIDCNNLTTTVTATGGGTYSWSGPGIASGGSTATATVNAGGAYTVTVTAANGCTNTANVTVSTDLTPPSPTASAAGVIDCNNSTTTVTATGGGTYSWSGPGIASGGSTATATVNAGGAYTVTVTAANGCTATANATVTTDLTPPSPTATANGVLDCNNSTTTVTATGGVSYSWTGPGVVSGSGAATATVNTIGTYTVTATGANGCTASTTTTVTDDYTTPTASVAPPGQLDCSNPSITIDGSASTNSSGTTTGLIYSWSASNGGVISGAANGATITATSAGDYTLLLTQANGCTNQVTVSVTANASLPSAVITGNANLTCSVTSITLDGSTSTGGTLTYQWLDASNNPLGSNATYTVTSPGTYNLQVTNTANSCQNTTSVIVNQDITLPNVVVAPPVTVDCNNPVIVLDGSGSDQGANFTYTWANYGSGILLGSGSADSDSTSTADSYTLIIQNTTNGCVDSASVSVAVDTVLPVSNAGADQILTCSVTTVNLDGTASSGTGITYSWGGPGIVSGGNTSTATVNQSGDYILTVTGSNGCMATDTAIVTPDANLPVANAGLDMVIDCSNSSVVLDGSASDAGANITYAWSTTNGNVVSGGATNQATVDIDGTYTLTVTNTSNGCTANDNVNVTMDTVAPVANAGSSTAQTITCSAVTVTLDASASTGTGLTYNWTTSNGNIVSGGTTANPDVDAAGTYLLTVTGSNGCTNMDSVTISIDTVVPTASLSGIAGSLNCNVTSVNLDGTASSGSNITYQWTTANGNIVSGATSSIASVDAAGSYLLTVTSDNGCTDTVSVNVVSTPAPIAGFDATPDNGQMPLDVTFTNTSTGSGLTYNWDFGDGNSDTATNPMNTYVDWGQFTAVLVVTDSAGCTSDYSVVISVTGASTLTVPNIFSPNDDGQNDVFNLSGTNIVELSGTIMNRWGQLMYEWDTLMAGWDGRTLAGEKASEGVYYYFITAKGADDKEYKFEGTFELVR